MDMLGMVVLSSYFGMILLLFLEGKGKSQMAALIASHKKLHTECHVYLWKN